MLCQILQWSSRLCPQVPFFRSSCALFKPLIICFFFKHIASFLLLFLDLFMLLFVKLDAKEAAENKVVCSLVFILKIIIWKYEEVTQVYM